MFTLTATSVLLTTSVARPSCHDAAKIRHKTSQPETRLHQRHVYVTFPSRATDYQLDTSCSCRIMVAFQIPYSRMHHTHYPDKPAPLRAHFFVSCQHTVSHSRTHTLIFTNSYTGIHEYHGTYSRIRFGHHTSMSIINTHEYGEESTYTHCHAARIPYPIRKSICSTKCFTNMRIFQR